MTDTNLPEDFVTLLVNNQRRLYTYILTLVPNLADAEDVLQETNAVLLRKQDQYEMGTNFGAWAARVAYLEACTFFKRNAKTSCFAPGHPLLESLAVEAEKRLDGKDRKLGALSHCFELLSDGDREMVAMRYRQNNSAAEIAQQTGRSPQAIRQVLYRIRTDLLRCIKHQMAQEERT